MKNSFKQTLCIKSISCKVYYLTAILFSNILICLCENQISKKFQYSSSTLNEYFEVNKDLQTNFDVETFKKDE